MKLFFLIYVFCGWITASAQAVGVFGGRSLMPADYIAVKYLPPSNSPLQLSAQVYRESSNRNQLHFVSYGAITAIEFASTQHSFQSSSLSYRISMGAVFLIEKEPWIWTANKPHPKTGFGCMGELSGVWNISSAFSLCVFGQQRWLFKKLLGNYQFVFGVGLIYQLNSND